MELPGAQFFYVLATVAMTFVGFATIVIALRQGTGRALTALQVLTTKQFIEFGFIAAGFALLPPLLSLSAVPDDLNWRVSSLVILALRGTLFAVYPRRRGAAAPDRGLPVRYWVNLTVFALIAVALLFNAVGWPFAPGPAPIAIAASHTLAAAAWLFLRTFNLFLDG